MVLLVYNTLSIVQHGMCTHYKKRMLYVLNMQGVYAKHVLHTLHVVYLRGGIVMCVCYTMYIMCVTINTKKYMGHSVEILRIVIPTRTVFNITFP